MKTILIYARLWLQKAYTRKSALKLFKCYTEVKGELEEEEWEDDEEDDEDWEDEEE